MAAMTESGEEEYIDQTYLSTAIYAQLIADQI